MIDTRELLAYFAKAHPGAHCETQAMLPVRGRLIVVYSVMEPDTLTNRVACFKHGAAQWDNIV